jgi:serine/threonine protein kinase
MKLEGVYETENSIYVILEYLQGQQLNDLIKSGKKLEIDETRTILQNILRGLSHLTKHRIIHRDLKPENIMFKNENCLELAIGDFGLATNAE